MVTQSAPKKTAPVAHTGSTNAKSLEVLDVKESLGIFEKYKFIFLIFAGSIISISLFFNLIFFINNQSLEKRILRTQNKLRAAVMHACKIDLAVDQKAVSFEWEDDSEGNSIYTLKCVPAKLKKKE